MCKPRLVLTPSNRHSRTHRRSMEWSTGMWLSLKHCCLTQSNTHINCTKWEGEKVFLFPEFSPRSLYGTRLLQYLYRFQFMSQFFKIPSVPSLPLLNSKQKTQVARKKIYSTASAGGKKVELNWIELNWSVTRGLTQYIWCSQITGWCLGLEGFLIPESIWSSIFLSVWVNINKVWSLSDLFTPPRRI